MISDLINPDLSRETNNEQKHPAGLMQKRELTSEIENEKPTDADGWAKQWFAQHKDADVKSLMMAL
jgi:hypothetical protein